MDYQPGRYPFPKSKFRSGTGDRKPAVFHAFGADERIGNLPDGLRHTLYHQYFQAVVVIQMDMKRGEDVVVVVVLQIGQPLAQKSHMMIVNKGNGADNITFRPLPYGFHQLVANHVAKGLGPVRVATHRDMVVELLQKFGIDGYPNSTEFTHGFSSTDYSPETV